MRQNKTFVLSLILGYLFGPGVAGAQQPGEQLVDPPGLKAMIPKRVVYAVPGMDQVKVRKDLVYKRVAGAELKMDVYSPPGPPNSRQPAVVFIHGGYLPPNLLTKPKEWGVYVSYGQLLAASGLVGITFNHRFYGWNSLSDSQSDVADLIEYVRANADTLGIDKDRIALWAFSGGGPFLSQALRDSPVYIRCLVSYYALLDLQGLRKDIPAAITDEILNEHSPVYQLSRNERKRAPIFIARAGLDNPVLNAGVERFVHEALSKNMTIDLSNHPEGHHGFDILDDNERSREIIKRTIDFIKAHL